MEIRRLDFVINAIEEAKELTGRGRKVVVFVTEDNELMEFLPRELKLILANLQYDKGILKVIGTHWELDLGIEDVAFMLIPGDYFVIELLDNFEQWCADYWAKREQASESLLPVSEDKEAVEAETVYSITYTKAREILLNGNYQIAKPDSFGENELVFGYLYEHPNAIVTRAQIKKGISRRKIKPLNKIVENLGFTHALRKAFFSVSPDSIQFRNPIKSRDLAPSVVAELNCLITKD